MAFVKLDCGILNSTIWFDMQARNVFITALLMAEPMELTETTPTLSTDSLEDGGFQIPPGWYGYVPSSGPGILARAGLDRKSEEGSAALRRLSSPEPESRSQDFDGRRMVRISGGYIILNYIKYRERDHTNAERCKRWREKSKATRHVVKDNTGGDMSATRAGVSKTSRNMQAEAESPPETEKQNSEEYAERESDARERPAIASLEADPGRETICPLDLLSREPIVGMLRELAERLPAPLVSLQSEATEFLSYWTIGAGQGLKRSGWPRKLREHLRQRHLANELKPPGAVSHAARNGHRVAGRPEPAEYIPSPETVALIGSSILRR